MHDLSILPFTFSVFVTVVVALLLRWLRQPYVVAYIVVGVLLGPHALAVVSDSPLLVQLGTVGVLFLLFFVGMELELPDFVASWRVPIIGTLLQVVLSVACVWGLGWCADWPIERIVVVGLVVSLSSTAVIVKMLEDRGLLASKLGRDILGVLLVQDLLIVPMLVAVTLLGGEEISSTVLMLQGVGALGILLLISWVLWKGKIQLPFLTLIRRDHEIEVFVALLLCFGLAVMTELLHLSAALGAFLGGIIISAASETNWVVKALEPFKIFFVGLFFVTVGMLIDLSFLWQNIGAVLVVLLVVLLTNTFVNAGIFFALGDSLGRSLLAGAFLAQVGELSFLLAAVGYKRSIISIYAYQFTICTISLSLLLSPAWIAIVQRVANKYAAEEPGVSS